MAEPQLATSVEIMVSEFGLSKKQANEVMAAYTHDYVLEKIKLVVQKKVKH